MAKLGDDELRVLAKMSLEWDTPRFMRAADAIAELIEARAEVQSLKVALTYHRDRATKLQTEHAGRVVGGETERVD